MRELITGWVGIVLFLAFVTYYTYRVHSIPLWIMLAIAGFLATADYVATARAGLRNRDRGHDPAA